MPCKLRPRRAHSLTRALEVPSILPTAAPSPVSQASLAQVSRQFSPQPFSRLVPALPLSSIPSPLTPFSLPSPPSVGKTTVILSLIRQLNASAPSPPSSPPVVWLKNEFGDAAIDTQLSSQPSLTTREIVNGCICCTAVGSLDSALSSALALRPSHLLLETAGSSSPATLAAHLTQLAASLPFHLQAIVCVIDCVSFPLTAGVGGAAATTRMQARYTDLLLVNKAELVDERRYDAVMDEVLELNAAVPRVKTVGGEVPVGLVLGVKGVGVGGYGEGGEGHWDEVGVVGLETARKEWVKAEVERWLQGLRRDEVFRVKGLLHIGGGGEGEQGTAGQQGGVEGHGGHRSHAGHEGYAGHEEHEGCGCEGQWSVAPVWVLNFAFGRWTWTALEAGKYHGPSRLTLMGERDIMQPAYVRKLRVALQLSADDRLYPITSSASI